MPINLTSLGGPSFQSRVLEMRKVFISLTSLVAAACAVTIVRRLSRSREMNKKVEELQDKFRGLDAVASDSIVEPVET